MINRRNLLVSIAALGAVKFRRDDSEQCGNCRFYNAVVQPAMCMRYPQAVKKAATDWCGEYQRGKNQFSAQ